VGDQLFPTMEDLAERWACKVSTIRNARPENLPEPFRRPGSRLVRYALTEVEAFERAHTAARDYVAERNLGLSGGPSILFRGARATASERMKSRGIRGGATSSIRSRTRSHARSLLSTARLKTARSRRRPSS